MTPKTNLTINPQRLWDSLMETAQYGGTPKGGIKRLTVSDDDKKVRDWFKAECEKLGCAVVVDEVGNMFATRPGKRSDLAPIAMGSHLDTQPTGGKFDGVLGVLGALEAMRTLVDMGYETNAPVMIVNWTNEEGSRFAPAMLCSCVYAGVFTTEFAYSREDRQGIKLGDELERIGYKGAIKAGDVKFQAMFELHIEQGPILEAENKMIGVVTGVQGMRWYEVTVRGQESHTGATPMGLRKNALLGASRMIEAIHQVGMGHLPGVASVGLLENRPNSRNVVPGEVFFTVDLRHPDEAVLDRMEAEGGRLRVCRDPADRMSGPLPFVVHDRGGLGAHDCKAAFPSHAAEPDASAPGPPGTGAAGRPGDRRPSGGGAFPAAGAWTGRPARQVAGAPAPSADGAGADRKLALRGRAGHAAGPLAGGGPAHRCGPCRRRALRAGGHRRLGGAAP